MKKSGLISTLCIALLLSGCASEGNGHLRRNCSIGIINVPVDNLADLRITAESFEVGLEALRGASQSRGSGETIYEWWPAMDAPASIEFQLKFKDGSSVTKQKVIAASHFNRFGISGVYLVNRNGAYSIETRYGIVHEYDGTHSSYINGWYFGDDGTLETLSHDQHLQEGQIGLGYTNATGKIILTGATRYIDQSVPRTTLIYHNTGVLEEIEIYHWDKPDGIEIFYAPDSTIRKVTRDKKIYHPGGVLLRDVIKEDITNQPQLYSNYRFPDISFTNQITFDPDQELATRNIKLRKDDL